ncbi:MAG: hypothetical protein KatS3mg077_0382 [Candidatus Binatia bacterium]|nr:MAG: hypothetical protein KatS3mg077_0382 [Candidatus Binatia bacterium]
MEASSLAQIRLLFAKPYLPGLSPRSQRRAARENIAQALARLADKPRGSGDPTDLASHPAWILGQDLFARGYYWEAHEAWESLWREVAVGAEERELLHVLLQWSASLLQLRCGWTQAAQRVGQRAYARLQRLEQQTDRAVVLGVHLRQLSLGLERFLRQVATVLRTPSSRPSRYRPRLPLNSRSS